MFELRRSSDCVFVRVFLCASLTMISWLKPDPAHNLATHKSPQLAQEADSCCGETRRRLRTIEIAIDLLRRAVSAKWRTFLTHKHIRHGTACLFDCSIQSGRNFAAPPSSCLGHTNTHLLRALRPHQVRGLSSRTRITTGAQLAVA